MPNKTTADREQTVMTQLACTSGHLDPTSPRRIKPACRQSFQGALALTLARLFPVPP